MTRRYLTVTALTKYIKRKIEMDTHLKSVWIKGEISNFKLHSRGHMYMTLKDDQTRIQAVMFLRYNQRLKFLPENGMNVLIKGQIGVFEPYGQYQLYIHEMEPDGIGSLYLAYEQLKEKLAHKGFFDERFKKELPRLPAHVGVITSPTGAAIRDIITTIHRRHPYTHITIIPTLVQGDKAARSIQKAIDRANAYPFDVLILTRGGGSLEELWSFNEEIVAEAIFNSKIPIISAVGHETDHTISDYVADHRAPTPTAAAEIAVPEYKELQKMIETIKRSLTVHMINFVEQHQQHLSHLLDSYAFRYPEQLFLQKEQTLDQLFNRLEHNFKQTFDEKTSQFEQLKLRFFHQHPQEKIEHLTKDLERVVRQLNNDMQQHLSDHGKTLKNALDQLSLLNPLEVMKRGYALPYTTKGQLITSVKQMNPSDTYNLHLQDGMIQSQVVDVHVKEEDDDDRQ